MAFSPSSALSQMPKIITEATVEPPLRAWLTHEPIVQVFTGTPV